MQTVSKEKLKQLIESGRAAGKDVKDLEKELKDGIKLSSINHCPKKTSGNPCTYYISTGPCRPEDFDDSGK